MQLIVIFNEPEINTPLMKRRLLTIINLFIILLSVHAQTEYKVGAFHYYPAIFMDSDGSAKGFYVDALKEIEKKENLKFSYVFGSWDECLERLKHEQIDMMVSVAHTKERAEYMDYGSLPLLTVWGEVYVNPPSDIDGIRDLEGKTIAIMKEDINSWYLQELARKLAINCNFIYAADSEDVFTKVALKDVDAGVVNNTFGASKSREYNLNSSGIIFNPFDIYFTVKKNKNEELLSLLNKYLKEWKSKSSSIYYTARQKWSHGKIGAIPVFPKWLKIAIISVVALLVLLLIFIVLLRYKVKLALEKLKNTQEHLSRAIYYAPFPIMIHADDGEVIAISDAWTELTGYTHDNIPNISAWTEKAYKNKGTVVKDYIDRLYAYNRKIEDGEFEIYTSLGDKITWDFSSAPLGQLEDGRRLVISMAKDVTERKMYESELIRAKERAVKSDKLKSAFLANMSHEIRTPMNGILGFADLLRTPKLDSKKQDRYLEIITQSGNRMLNIINDIVDISKIESGLMELNVREVNIKQQLDELYEFFNPELAERDVILQCQNQLIDSESIIKTDGEKIYAVLLNLIKNAIKYCDEGIILYGCVKEGDQLKFFVKDTGIGIAKDRHKAIFERFIQAEIYDRNAKQGAGLGLTISKAYVEMLGGKIWVESEKGKGATFFFTIPFKPVLSNVEV